MNWFKKKRIYLDYAAATPVLPEVRREMEKYWVADFYNPNAIYEEGVRVKREVAEYRTRIAKVLGVAKESVIFTSGGTEANTWAIRGIKNGPLILDAESHPSVFDAAQGYKSATWKASEPLPLDKGTTLISTVSTENNVGRQARAWRKRHNTEFPIVHVDASQTAQYYNVALEALACDALTLDSAKLNGPKGIGALILRKGVKLELPPLGTPPVPLIAGFCVALERAARDRESERIRLILLSEKFTEAIRRGVPRAMVTNISPNIVNISVPGILPELLVLALDKQGVMVSAGPACDSNKPEPPETPVRFSFGRGTTEKELNYAVKIFCRIVGTMLK